MGEVIIAGDRSGSGKTTVTMALLSALRQQGETVQAFKVGPDYIDPMFHRAITGRPAYNLDPVLTSERYVKSCFQRHSAAATHAIVEGVMGLFDGAGGTDWASTAHIARLLGCPVVLVVDCARLSRSLAAIVHGYASLDPRVTVAGVVLNRVGSDRHLAMLKASLSAIGVPVLGVLRRDDGVALPDRHLGLVPTDELSDLPARFQQLATLGQRCFDWLQLSRLFRRNGQGPPVSDADDFQPWQGAAAIAQTPPLRIGVARDRAFNFYYEDNLEGLRRLGAEVVFFSPLDDAALPPDLSGLLLGGGFPEVFAEQLSQNVPMRRAVAQGLAAGLPTYAECGGLMVLCESLVDFEGRSWPMVGSLAATATMTARLTLGYRQVVAWGNSCAVTQGQRFWGHEFHRSAIAPVPPAPLQDLATYPLFGQAPVPAGQDGWGNDHLHASYVHLHWGDRPEVAQRFVRACRTFNGAGQSLL